MGQKKTVIITGASRGLGAATARFLAEYGASVVLNARSADALEDIAEEIHDVGGDVLVSVGDICQWEVCCRVIERAIERFGRIDALVNNAGMIEPIAAIAEADPKRWIQNWGVNLFGPVMLVQQALPYLRQVSGRVINISSGAAVRVIPGWGAYSIAKAAINHFTSILAVEEVDITAIALRPGVVGTEMQRTIREQGAFGMLRAEHERFVQQYEQGKILPAELPGRAIACLALFTPHEWSGEFLSWNDPCVQQLILETNA